MCRSGSWWREYSSGFYTLLDVGGVPWLIGNALGVLALRGWAWVFWVAISINVTQGLGVLGAVPPEFHQAALDAHRPLGMLPYLITDGGGLILEVILIASFVGFRTPWAYREYQD